MKAWTGLSGPQLDALITRLWRRRPDSGCGRPWSLAFGYRVLLVILGYRTNLTMEQPTGLFATTHAAVHRVTADLAPHLAALPGPPPADRRELWPTDDTLIPVHDQRKTKKPKNYRRSVNVQIVCRAVDRRIVAVDDAWPGNRNDAVVFRETTGKTLPDHPRLSGDGGYPGIERIRSPRRGPDRKIIKDRDHRRFRKRRAVAEHTIARLKDHQVLRQCRRKGEGINHTVAGIAALHNLKLEIND
ncbi:transposase [Streptomyces sp. LZ34]